MFMLIAYTLYSRWGQKDNIYIYEYTEIWQQWPSMVNTEGLRIRYCKNVDGVVLLMLNVFDSKQYFTLMCY